MREDRERGGRGHAALDRGRRAVEEEREADGGRVSPPWEWRERRTSSGHEKPLEGKDGDGRPAA